MQGIMEKVTELLDNGTVDRVLAWKAGEFSYDRTPAVFDKESGLDGLVYDSFCVNNLSKYLIEESKKDGKVLVLMKPCDSYGLNMLLKEHRVDREKIYILGVPCKCKVSVDKIKATGLTGILDIVEDGNDIKVTTVYGDTTLDRRDVLCDKCMVCKDKVVVVYDEKIESDETAGIEKLDRMAEVEALEAMIPEERFNFWRSQLSKCIRCNACRNVCPICSCTKCVFDNDNTGISSKANVDSFEENMFHIVRAYHVAGRCTDCGECSRVCPQNIPLHLLNRKFIKDMNELYGTYQAGTDAETKDPLTAFTKEDAEPSVIYNR